MWIGTQALGIMWKVVVDEVQRRPVIVDRMGELGLCSEPMPVRGNW